MYKNLLLNKITNAQISNKNDSHAVSDHTLT